MSGSRQDWLDDETAERLLRGEPVDAGNTGTDEFDANAAHKSGEGHAIAIAALLNAARDTDLPVRQDREDAALAAFRAARTLRVARAAAASEATRAQEPREEWAGRAQAEARAARARTETRTTEGRNAEERTAHLRPAVPRIPAPRTEQEHPGVPRIPARSGADGIPSHGLAEAHPERGRVVDARDRFGRTRGWPGSTKVALTAVFAATLLASGVTAAAVGVIPSFFSGPGSSPRPSGSHRSAPLPPQMTEPAGSQSGTPTSTGTPPLRPGPMPQPHLSGDGTDVPGTYDSTVRELCRQYLGSESGQATALPHGSQKWLNVQAGGSIHVDPYCRARLAAVGESPWAVPSPPAVGGSMAGEGFGASECEPSGTPAPPPATVPPSGPASPSAPTGSAPTAPVSPSGSPSPAGPGPDPSASPTVSASPAPTSSLSPSPTPSSAPAPSSTSSGPAPSVDPFAPGAHAAALTSAPVASCDASAAGLETAHHSSGHGARSDRTALRLPRVANVTRSAIPAGER